MESHSPPHRHWRWPGLALVALVVVCLATGFYLLERQRDEQLLRESVALTESLDGDVVGARFRQPQVTSGQLKSLRRFPMLKRLEFSGTRSQEGDLEPLRDLPSVTAIELSRVNWLDEAVMGHIADVPRLSDLTLSESNINDAGLARLAGHPQLRSLSLQGCDGISDASVQTLVSLSSLEGVILAGTRLSPAGFRRLRIARQDLLINYSPDSQSTGVALNSYWGGSLREERPEGLTSIASSASTADLVLLLTTPHHWATGAWTSEVSLKNVRSLELSGPSAAESMAWLAHRLQQLNSINIPGSALREAAGASLAGVSEAVITDVAPADELNRLASMPQVRSLTIELTVQLDTNALPDPNLLPHLEHLTLRGAGVDRSILTWASQIVPLAELRLEVPATLDAQALHELSELPHLSHVSLEGPGVSDALIAALSGLSQLDSLRVRVTTSLGPDAFKPLSALPHLSRIQLTGPGVNDSHAASLAQFPALETVFVEVAPVSDAGFAPFLDSPRPPQIFASGTGISQEMVLRLREAARKAAEASISPSG